MNYIEKKANKIVEQRLSRGRLGDVNKLLQIVGDDLYEIDSDEDKVVYLTVILEANDLAYNEHLKVCQNPNTCTKNEDHERINYILQQELRKVGVETSEDVFSREEKATIVDELNRFASDLKDLKDGQQIIYDDLLAEIQELKKWFVVGKKNWRQMAVGKVGEMVVGGIISEATAKPLLEAVKSGTQYLLH